MEQTNEPILSNNNVDVLPDNESFIVERILSHKGSFTKKKHVQIEVKWEGYPEPTWEPWKNVMYSAPLHDYLREHKLERHIPAAVEDA